MTYEFDPPAVHSLAIAESVSRFPVRHIWCVGRNYAAHAREMGQDEREPPFFFMKPAGAIVDASLSGCQIPYPPQTTDFQHEVELVVAIGGRGRDVPLEQAGSLIFGYAVGLDMTRRDLQLQARKSGRPWEFGKSFLHSAPIGAICPVRTAGLAPDAPITLDVNGASRQSSQISKMIWDVAECISFLSKYEELQPGDIIMTGTPEGVGPVSVGDVMRAAVGALTPVEVQVSK